jgi:hypothetical protein
MMTNNRLNKKQAIDFAEERVWIESGRPDEYVLKWLWNFEGEEKCAPYVGERRTPTYPEQSADEQKLFTAMEVLGYPQDEIDRALHALKQAWELYTGTDVYPPEPGTSKPDWKTFVKEPTSA